MPMRMAVCMVVMGVAVIACAFLHAYQSFRCMPLVSSPALSIESW
jgi:hypothetical protein